MSIEVGADYVQSGLVSLYDPKSRKSYPGTGSTLFDLVGGYNLSIFGSPAFNSSGYFTFSNNQITEYMQYDNYPHPTTAVTYNIWFRSNFTSNQQTPFAYSIAGNNHMICFITSATNWRPYTLDSLFDIGVSTMANVWVNLSWSYLGVNGMNRYYRDGTFLTTRDMADGANMSANGRLIIGQEPDSGFAFDANQNLDGDFGFFAIYNRILTDEEVKQNFNALRGRYGI